jgi:hypothetical protein
VKVKITQGEEVNRQRSQRVRRMHALSLKAMTMRKGEDMERKY